MSLLTDIYFSFLAQSYNWVTQVTKDIIALGNNILFTFIDLTLIKIKKREILLHYAQNNAPLIL